MNAYQRPIGPPPDRYSWVPAGISAVLTVTIGIMLVIAWRRFLDISPRLGVEADGRRIFTVAILLIEAVLIWRAWTLVRRARRLWHEARD